MAVDQLQIASQFRGLYLFRSLGDVELIAVASRFEWVQYDPGEYIYSQGAEGDYFYIINNGEVAVSRKVGNIDAQLDVLVDGDFFGEEALLSEQPRSVSVLVVAHSTLLRLDKQQFMAMLEEFPSIKTSLIRIVESHRFTRTHQFDWLGDDEVIYQVRRKHQAYLMISLIGPVLLGFMAAIILFVGLAGGFATTLAISTYVISGIFFFFGLGWGVWKYIDWGNDYYIVTDQRVVWIEHVVGLYDSRVEAPLTTILSVNVTTKFLGRIFGYGDVIVRTFTGQIELRIVGEPKEMAALIEEYWHRAQRGRQKADEKEMEHSVRLMIGLEPEEKPGTREPVFSKPVIPMDYREPAVEQKYFGNIFKMRFEEGNTVTYRKHWVVLLRKTWIPTLLIALVIMALLVYDALYLIDRYRSFSPLLCQSAGILLILLVLLPWWLYNYVDWRNDIYQVTDKNIFDIERKPLGTEVRKSAPLENILSLEHERPGLLGYFFNYGNVIINIGDEKFLFLGVHEPARVQQDVFNRMYLLRQQKERTEVARERDRILALLATYHRNVEDAQ